MSPGDQEDEPVTAEESARRFVETDLSAFDFATEDEEPAAPAQFTPEQKAAMRRHWDEVRKRVAALLRGKKP